LYRHFLDWQFARLVDREHLANQSNALDTQTRVRARQRVVAGRS
jgi:hypothetical protein